MSEKPIRASSPQTWVGAYILDAYCDCLHEPGHSLLGEAVGQTKREAMAVLRAKGWRFNSDRTATCPACVKAGAPKP